MRFLLVLSLQLITDDEKNVKIFTTIYNRTINKNINNSNDQSELAILITWYKKWYYFLVPLSVTMSIMSIKRSDSCFYATYRAFINCFSSSR